MKNRLTSDNSAALTKYAAILRDAGAMVMRPYFLAGKAEALHLADRTSEAIVRATLRRWDE